MSNQQSRSPIINHIRVDSLNPEAKRLMQPLLDAAEHIDDSLDNCAEKSAGLRKLVEAYDCFLRAHIEGNSI